MNKEKIERLWGLNYGEHSLALQIIGCNISTYGHFDVYEIPDDSGHGMMETELMNDPKKFLERVEEFYNDENMVNKDYEDDVKESRKVKKFVLKRIKDGDFEKGVAWLEEMLGDR